MGSLKSSRATLLSSIVTLALNCLVFEKIAFFGVQFSDGRIDRQTDGQSQRTSGVTRI